MNRRILIFSILAILILMLAISSYVNGIETPNKVVKLITPLPKKADVFSLPSNWPGQVAGNVPYVPPLDSVPEQMTRWSENSYPKLYGISLSNVYSHFDYYVPHSSTVKRKELLARYDISEVPFEASIYEGIPGTTLSEEIKDLSSVDTDITGRTMFRAHEVGWQKIGGVISTTGNWAVPTSTPGARATTEASCNKDDFYCNRRAQDWMTGHMNFTVWDDSTWLMHTNTDTDVFFNAFGAATNNTYNGKAGVNGMTHDAIEVNGDTYAEWNCKRIWQLFDPDKIDFLREDISFVHVTNYILPEGRTLDSDRDGVADHSQWTPVNTGDQNRFRDLFMNYGLYDMYNCIRNNGIPLWGNAIYEPDNRNLDPTQWVYRGEGSIDGAMIEMNDGGGGPMPFWSGWAGSEWCNWACEQKIMNDWNKKGKSGVILGKGFMNSLGWFPTYQDLLDFKFASTLMQNFFFSWVENSSSYNISSWSPDYWVTYDGSSKCVSTDDPAGAKWLGPALDEGTNGGGVTLDSYIDTANHWAEAANFAWIRQFEFGVAVANPTGSDMNVSFPRSTHTYKEVDSDASLVGSVFVPAHSGKVLCDITTMSSAPPPTQTHTPTPTPLVPTETHTPTPTPTNTHTPTPTPNVPVVTQVSLNEVSLNTIDTNRNGVSETVLDQCIEVYNPKDTTESIAGWSLWSDDTMLYRYISGHIRPQHVYVVWGSSLGSALPASSTIRLKDETGSIIDSILVDYSNDVLAREPNGSTTWQWSSGLSSSSCGKDN